jgi:hypothetical protein
MGENFEMANAELCKLIPQSEWDKVMAQPMCDIDAGFLGFVDVYEALSKIIPKHFTVIDLGCGYNPQSYFFTGHKRYIAVDNFEDRIRFCAPNCVMYEGSIEDFLKNPFTFNLQETFAICSYVPSWGGDNGKMVREAFPNLFVYYPHGGYDLKFMGK